MSDVTIILTEVRCGDCGTDLVLEVTPPAAAHGVLTRFVHIDRLGQTEPEFCRNDDGSAFADAQAAPMCPCCSGPLERVPSGWWVCREFGSTHYMLTEAGVETVKSVGARAKKPGVPA